MEVLLGEQEIYYQESLKYMLEQRINTSIQKKGLKKL